MVLERLEKLLLSPEFWSDNDSSKLRSLTKCHTAKGSVRRVIKTKLLSSSFTENLFVLRLQKSADKDLKNHYIASNKTLRNNGKNTYKKQVCNQQIIR